MPEAQDQPTGPAEDDEPAPSAEAAETAEVSEQESVVPHRDDGLDLARTIAQATAASGSGLPRRRRSTGSVGSTGSTGSKDGAVSRRAVSRRGAVSGAHPDERDPQLLGNELSRLVGDRGWDLPLRLQGVFARWPELVGEEIAAHGTPESFTDGRLVVRTGSTAWATQLKLLAPTVLRRLNEELGPGTVMVVEVLGPHGPTWKKGSRSVRDGRGPRDTYG